MRKTAIALLLITLTIALTTANVVASHIVYKPLMYRLITLRDVGAAREFLGNLEGSPWYLYQSQYLNSIFDNVLAQEIDTKYLNLEKNIVHYESILKRSPKNRDVLIKLALLYKDQGSTISLEKAKGYYLSAKETDPWVKIEGLEKL